MGTGLIELYRRRVKRSWKIAFISAFFIGMLVHMYKFTNTLLNHDSLFNFYSDQNILGSGRWFLSFSCQFSSYFDLPWVIGVLSVFLISLTAVVVVDVFQIENPVMLVLTGGLLASFPAVTQTFYFEFTADGYMLAMLLAALAVRFSLMGDNVPWHIAAACGCICLCCAIYQAYVSFALVFALCYFVLELLEDCRTTKEIVCWIRNQAIIYICGLAVYYIIWQLLMKLSGYTATTYEGISTIGQMNIHNINGAIYQTADSFIHFFVEWNIFRHGLTAYTTLNLIFLLSAFIIGITALVKSKIIKQRLRMFLLFAAVFAIPFAAFMWYFASYGVSYATRMEQSLCLLYIFVGVLYCRWAKECFANIAALVLMAIILNNSVTANIFYYKMNQCSERSYATALEMASRIHQLDDGTIMQIAIIGSTAGFDDNYYFEPSGARQLGVLRQLNRNLMSSSKYISLYLSNVLDFQLSYYNENPDAEMPTHKKGKEDPVSQTWTLSFPLCDTETVEKLQGSDAVQAMGCWPAADSVQAIGDTVIIKLSEPETEEES